MLGSQFYRFRTLGQYNFFRARTALQVISHYYFVSRRYYICILPGHGNNYYSMGSHLFLCVEVQ